MMLCIALCALSYQNSSSSGHPAIALGRGAQASIAIEHGDIAKLKKLLREGQDPTWKDGVGSTTLLHYACANTRGAKLPTKEIVKTLLEAGADPNAGDAGDPTALFWCMGIQKPGVITLLGKFGADPNKLNSIKLSALYKMIAFDREPRSKFDVKEILEIGADPNLRIGIARPASVYQTTTEMTALHAACWFSRLDAAQLLIKHGARVNEASSLNQYPLHLAAMKWQSLDIVKLLLAHGARKDVKDYTGRTPYQVAVARGNDDAAALLKP